MDFLSFSVHACIETPQLDLSCLLMACHVPNFSMSTRSKFNSWRKQKRQQVDNSLQEAHAKWVISRWCPVTNIVAARQDAACRSMVTKLILHHSMRLSSKLPSISSYPERSPRRASSCASGCVSGRCTLARPGKHNM